VTNFVPGVVGTNQPRGSTAAMISARLTPASAVNTPVASSNARNRLSPVISATASPSFNAASP